MLESTPAQLPTSRWALLALLLLGVGAYQVGLSREVVEGLTGAESRAEAPFGLDGTAPRIQWVSAAAERAGLRPGDTVVSVDGRLVSGAAVVERSLAGH